MFGWVGGCVGLCLVLGPRAMALPVVVWVQSAGVLFRLVDGFTDLRGDGGR